jgi:hypothetical protein
VENGVREARIWRQVLGVEKTVIEGVDFDETAEAVIVSVRPQARAVPVRAVRSALPRLRRGCRAAAVARPGLRPDPHLRRGRDTPGGVP